MKSARCSILLTLVAVAAGSLFRTSLRAQDPPELEIQETADAAPVSQEQLSPERRAVLATVRLTVHNSDDTNIVTGTVIGVHGDDALALTCGHAFRDSLPHDKIDVELCGRGESDSLRGELIFCDADRRDLALVKFRARTPVAPMPIAGEKFKVVDRQSVFRVGCEEGGVARSRGSFISAVNRYVGPPNIEAKGAPPLGCAGGGLFTPEGILIGVCNASDPSDDEGIFASAETVRALLTEIGRSRSDLAAWEVFEMHRRIRIVVADRDVTMHEVLSADSLRYEDWPWDRVPAEAVHDIQRLVGKSPNMLIHEGEPILSEKLADDSFDALPPVPLGYRVAPIAVEELPPSEVLLPGDRVDLLLYLPKSSEVREAQVRTIFRGVRVFAIDGRRDRALDKKERANDARSISVLIPSAQVERLILAKELGKFHFAIRGHADEPDDAVVEADAVVESKAMEAPRSQSDSLGELEAENARLRARIKLLELKVRHAAEIRRLLETISELKSKRAAKTGGGAAAGDP
ncbi:MAG: Flp pilus assembly protein CpaB [Pirellulaceae bacterium]